MGVQFNPGQPGYNPRQAAQKYEGGKAPPKAAQMSAQMQSTIRGAQGIDEKGMDEKDVQKLLDAGWTYGRPAPPGFSYNDDGLLKKNGSLARTIGKIAIIGGSIAITVATGGATSPLVAGAIGAGTGAALAAVDGAGWKGILTGAVIGGVTGGAAAGIAGAGLNTAQQIGANAAVGAGTGAIQGGARGALFGAAGGAGGASIAPAAARVAPSGLANTATQAGLTAGLNRSLGATWTDSLVSGGMAASQNAANQQRQNAYRQAQQARMNESPLARAVRG